MPRLRGVSRAEAAPEVLEWYNRLFGERDPVVAPGTETGTPGNWWTVMARVPDVFQAMVSQFPVINSRKRKLAPELRELAIVRTGYAAGSKFVFSQHSKVARATGVGAEKVAAIPSWATWGGWSDEERAVLAYVDELVLADGRVSDGTFERLLGYLGEEGVIELTFVSCTYRLHAIMTRALRLEYDDVEERVVEEPAPRQGS